MGRCPFVDVLHVLAGLWCWLHGLFALPAVLLVDFPMFVFAARPADLHAALPSTAQRFLQGRGGWPCCSLDAKACLNQGASTRVSVRRHGRRLPPHEQLADDLLHAGARLEGLRGAEELEHNATHLPNVYFLRDPSCILKLLRRHVSRGPLKCTDCDMSALEHECETEIAYLAMQGLVEHDIRSLQITMHNPETMKVGQTLRNLKGHPSFLLEFDVALLLEDEIVHGTSWHVLHQHEDIRRLVTAA
mmetsp:Transcript_2418/g.4344  ORF Transcript_2418/g.4344 Transcript_2418/m.4344 type:complete len:246 (-) Transcript_2418:2266-3003(-)